MGMISIVPTFVLLGHKYMQRPGIGGHGPPDLYIFPQRVSEAYG